jgi:transposase-like protein
MTTIEPPAHSNILQRQSRRRFTPRERKRLVGLYEKSGHSARAFCDEHDVSPSSLWRWLARAREPGCKESEGGGLVEIPMLALATPNAPSAAVRMELAGGTRLEIATGTDTAWLAALVRALVPASV